MTTPPSYYQQYPGYPPQQPPQQPPASSSPPAGQPSSVEPPPTQTPPQPTYVDLPAEISWAQWRALEASNIAAGKPPAQFAVKGPEGPPEEFPKTLYNKDKHLTKAATDKKDEEKLQGEGYSETPFSPPALEIPPAMIQHLETVFAAAAVALKELKQLVQQQQQQQQAGSQPSGTQPSGTQQATGQQSGQASSQLQQPSGTGTN